MVIEIEEISQEEVEKTVSAYLKKEPFILRNFQIKPASDNPLGFLGDHVRLTVNITVDNSDKELKFFVKKIPTKLAHHYEYATEIRAFYKEIELYKTLLDDIRNATSNKYQLKWMPEFYYSRGEHMLIVEDLSEQGYFMLPERTLMGLEYIEVAIDTMAVMHAGSFIFEEKLNSGKAATHSDKFTAGEKVTIGTLYEHLLFETEASDIKGHPGNRLWEAGFHSQVSLIDVMPGYTPEQRKVIKDNITEKLRKVFQLVKPSDKFKNVLLHGDLWANNLLFRKSETGVASGAVMVDFQLARYGPPAHDILMFLFLVQNREFRKNHQEALLNRYYNKLSAELAAEGLDINTLLPRNEFDKSIEHYREYGIINNVLYFQLMIVPGEIASDFLSSPESYTLNMLTDRSEMMITCFQKDKFYNDRMSEAVREMAEYYNWV